MCIRDRNGIVIPSFVNEVLETPCPVCGREIEILLNGYASNGISLCAIVLGI